MSRHEPGSDLSRLNAAAVGEWVQLEEGTLCVFAFALQLSAQTGGVFDVCTAGGQKGAWRDLELDRPYHRIRKHAPLQADLGGIAKGYAVDLAVSALQSAGMHAGWVNAGGDVRVFGDVEVPLMVRSPREVSRLIACTRLRERAAATSARYLAADPDAHLFNGATGQAIKRDESWTVAAPHCMTADALTKLVAATGDARHPLLAHYGAEAWIC
jgi:thiamine biosynthesis lipoprotein